MARSGTTSMHSPHEDPAIRRHLLVLLLALPFAMDAVSGALLLGALDAAPALAIPDAAPVAAPVEPAATARPATPAPVATPAPATTPAPDALAMARLTGRDGRLVILLLASEIAPGGRERTPLMVLLAADPADGSAGVVVLPDGIAVRGLVRRGRGLGDLFTSRLRRVGERSAAARSVAATVSDLAAVEIDRTVLVRLRDIAAVVDAAGGLGIDARILPGEGGRAGARATLDGPLAVAMARARRGEEVMARARRAGLMAIALLAVLRDLPDPLRAAVGDVAVARFRGLGPVDLEPLARLLLRDTDPALVVPGARSFRIRHGDARLVGAALAVLRGTMP